MNKTTTTTAAPLVLLTLLTLVPTCRAQTDRVRTSAGLLSGEVTKVSPLEVTLERGDRQTPVSVAEIRSIQFGDEPSELTQARLNALNGAYKKALETLATIDRGAVRRDEVVQDIDYYAAYCNARLALMGEGSVTDAGAQLNSFVNANRQSFHFLEANKLLGDLLVALGNNEAALKKYELLAKSRIPAYKVRSAVLAGRTLQAEEKHAEAIERFDQAAAMADDSPEGKTQRLAADLGKAVSMAATGRVDEGVALVRSVIAAADPEEQALQAEAYNALGGCYLQANQTKAALFAYLHVDLLYDSQPEAHAEALYHLAELWDTIGKTSDARQARQTLKERYASTEWANK